MWLLPFIMAKFSATSLTLYLATTNKDDASLLLHRGIERQECINMYIGAVSYIPNLYKTDDVKATAASQIGLFKKYNSRRAVWLANPLKDMALRSRDAFSKQHTKLVSVKELLLNVRDNMQTYWVAQSTMHPRQLAQYADTLTQFGGRTLSSSTTIQPGSLRQDYARNQPQKDAFERGHETCNERYAVVAPSETTSNGEQRTRADEYQQSTSRALLRRTPKLCHSRVSLGHDYAMEPCLFTVYPDKWEAIREAN